MKKIPTMFKRGAFGKITNEITPGCEWVAAGEGVATHKLDGTCCMVRDGKIYKRREIQDKDTAPADFEPVERDQLTLKTVGWVPVNPTASEDKWIRDAFSAVTLFDGTYEACGPKIQGNPECFEKHVAMRHEILWSRPIDAPRDFAGLQRFFEDEAGRNMEGIVFCHPDGRMAKIKAKDFGLKRKA